MMDNEIYRNKMKSMYEIDSGLESEDSDEFAL